MKFIFSSLKKRKKKGKILNALEKPDIYNHLKLHEDKVWILTDKEDLR